MCPYSAMSPIPQRLVQVQAIVEKIAGVNGPLLAMLAISLLCHIWQVDQKLQFF